MGGRLCIQPRTGVQLNVVADARNQAVLGNSATDLQSPSVLCPAVLSLELSGEYILIFGVLAPLGHIGKQLVRM
jgi:hypothetical protein